MNIIEKEKVFFREIDRDHPLNQDLVIPFMEAGGAYHIIADICNLECIGEGLFVNTNGMKYVLTKYGFIHRISYNYQVKYTAAVRELRQLKSDFSILESNCDKKIKGTLKNLEDQVISNNKKIKNQAEDLNSHREKVARQAKHLTNQRDRIKSLYAELNQNNYENK